ncbi:MAG: hypothetical protein M3168_01610 [Actinomycetota bacterium]|nr:hypothetical protein [Actinomycetota bacterium]
MLRRVGLAEQWREIERGLPERWGDARLSLTIDDARAVTARRRCSGR